MDNTDVKDREHTEAGEERMSKNKVQARKSWDVIVDVYLHSEAAGDFDIESYLQSSPPSKKLIFWNNGHPGFNITFNLHDETNLGYKFVGAPNEEDSIWSQLGGTGCPGAPGAWEVFDKTSITITNAGMVMKAFNQNPSPAQGDFRYTINVTKDGGTTYLPLDPGGTNNNGSTGAA
jgi:hypothetical protein